VRASQGIVLWAYISIVFGRWRAAEFPASVSCPGFPLPAN
jgi:hypothetical protein